MTKDEEHLRLLSIFHYVVAGLSCFFSLFPVMYMAIGVFMLCGKFDAAHQDPGAQGIGWVFIAIGSVFFLAGLGFAVCVALAGRFLGRRRHYIFCMVMAAVTCMFMPFGTVLGVFTIIVLQKETVRQLFGRELSTPPPVGRE